MSIRLITHWWEPLLVASKLLKRCTSLEFLCGWFDTPPEFWSSWTLAERSMCMLLMNTAIQLFLQEPWGCISDHIVPFGIRFARLSGSRTLRFHTVHTRTCNLEMILHLWQGSCQVGKINPTLPIYDLTVYFLGVASADQPFWTMAPLPMFSHSFSKEDINDANSRSQAPPLCLIHRCCGWMHSRGLFMIGRGSGIIQEGGWWRATPSWTPSKSLATRLRLTEFWKPSFAGCLFVPHGYPT